MITTEQLAAIAGRPACSLMGSCIAALENSEAAEIVPPHRLAQFLAQVAHESERFRYAQELWGPTKTQRGYEGRVDLGNTQPGDGKRFRGRGLIELTGRTNYARFTAWAKGPDFETDPDALLQAPWLGLSAVWFWQEGNATGKSLNGYADQGNIEMITRRINGGLRGYADRLELYARGGLVLLGLAPDDVRGFQQQTPGLAVDGIAGPATRAALHAALLSKG